MAYKNVSSAPAATTATALYTVPSAKEAVVSTVVVCAYNGDDAFRIAVRPLGATLSNAHYVVYDATIAQGESKFFTLGIALQATDVLEVYDASGNCSFNAFYNEVDA